MGRDVVDPPLETRRPADLVERRSNGLRSGAVAAARIGDQKEDAFGH